MKQKFLFILAAVTALALGSCSWDDEVDRVQTKPMTGYWYSKVVRSGKVANMLTEDPDDMIRYDHVGAVLFFDNSNQGKGYWVNLYLKNDEIVNYDAPSNTDGTGRFTYSVACNGDINLSEYMNNKAFGKLRAMYYRHGTVKADFSGMAVDFSRATTEQSTMLEEWLNQHNIGQ